MIVYKCDRCKKELKNMSSLTQVKIGNLLINDYELCDSCTRELCSFLKHYKEKE